MTKERPHITIRTHKSGYDMTVNGQGYMYFTLKELIEGFFCRVACSETKVMTKAEQRNLMQALKQWPTQKTLIEQIKHKDEEIQEYRQTDLDHRSTIATLRNVIADLKKDGIKAPTPEWSQDSDVSTKGRVIPPKQFLQTVMTAMTTPVKNAGFERHSLHIIRDAVAIVRGVTSVPYEDITLEDVASLTRDQLKHMHGCGIKVLTDIQATLTRHHLMLGMDVETIKERLEEL
jgi:translation initiation factor 2B subunit (eIF-2B alpha/beta/delta family)